MVLKQKLQEVFNKGSEINSSIANHKHNGKIEYISDLISQQFSKYCSETLKQDNNSILFSLKDTEEDIKFNIVITKHIVHLLYQFKEKEILIQFGSCYYYCDFIPQLISYFDNLNDYFNNIQQLEENLDFSKVLFHFKHSTTSKDHFITDEEFMCLGFDLDNKIDIFNNKEMFYKEQENNSLISIQIFDR